MSFGIWQRTITDDEGNVLPGASIEVRAPSSNFTGALVSLFSDEAGSTGLANPFNADSEGFAQFYAAPRKVDIRATGSGSQRTWRNVEILGTAATQPTSRFPYVVGSVAELASVPEGLRVDGAAAMVSGADADDWRVYRWAASSTETADGDNTVAVTDVATGRWKKITGAAALRGVLESPTDNTPGAVLDVGAGGFLAPLPLAPSGESADDFKLPGATKTFAGGSEGIPPGFSTTTIHVFSSQVLGRVTQLATSTPTISSAETQKMAFRTSDSNGDFLFPWRELLSAVDLQGVIDRAGDLVVTVGSGGDYPTINAALQELSTKRNVISANGVELRLLAGFVQNEQVLLTNVDLSWVTITSEDAEVTINREALTQRFGEEPNNGSPDGSVVHFGNFPAWAAFDNCKMPIIDVLFRMNGTGTRTARNAFSFTNNCEGHIKPYKGCIDMGGGGIYATQNSRVYAYRAVMRNAGNGAARPTSENGNDGEKTTAVMAFRGSWVNFRQGDGSGASLDGCYVGSSSVVEALNANFSGAQSYGIRCYAGGRINVRDGNLTNCGFRGIWAHQAGTVYAGGADFTGSGQAQTSDETYPIFAEEGSQVDAPGAIFNTSNVRAALYISGAFGTLQGASFANHATPSANGSCVVVANGSRVDVRDAAVSNVESPAFRVSNGGIIAAAGTSATLSQTENTITADGIIFR